MIGLLFPINDTELVIHTDESIPNPNVSFQVGNVEEFIEEHKNKGKALMEPFDIRCGKCAIIQDPDGNNIEIMDITKFVKPRYDA
jgi:predicted enzyme related to lactoylglutathione lyase